MNIHRYLEYLDTTITGLGKYCLAIYLDSCGCPKKKHLRRRVLGNPGGERQEMEKNQNRVIPRDRTDKVLTAG